MPRLSPLSYLVISFIAGIIAQNLLMMPIIWLFFAAMVLLVVFLPVTQHKSSSLLFPLIGLALLFLAGALVMGIKQNQAMNSQLVKAATAKSGIYVSGIVSGEPRSGSRSDEFELEVKTVGHGRARRQVKERAIVTVSGGHGSIHQGQQALFFAQPNLIDLPKNRDYQSYLQRRGVYARFTLLADELKIKNNSSFGNRFRHHLRQLITTALPQPLSGLESAILFGDTTDIDRDTKDNFQRAGIYHLFAVSGLNLTLTVAFIFFVVRWLAPPPFIRLALGFVAVLFYLWLVGYSASVSRAAIMVIVLLLYWYLARRMELINAISLAALILLIMNPYQLYDVAFQLSFGAVIGIVFLAPVITGAFKPEIKRVVMPAAVALGAQLAVEPILAFYFNQLSVISVIANIALVPPVGAITGIGFLATALAFVSGPLALILFKATKPMLLYLQLGAAFFARLPGASMALPRPSATTIILYFLLLYMAAYFLSRLKRSAGFGVFTISLLAVVVVGIWSQVPAALSPPKLEVAFLDVGQGDAVLIKDPQNHVILLDGGVNYQLLKKKLDLRAVRKIDLMILSHAHADHVSGLVGVLEDYPVGQVLDPGFPHPSPIYKDFLKVIKRKKIEYKLGREGQLYRWGRVKLRIFRPPNDFIEGSNSDVNNSSIVARLTYGNFHLFLPGDMEREAITQLLEEHKDISADVLKVAHHGSYTGTTVKLLRAIKPREAVISVGKYNLYGHPHRQALKRLRTAGVRVWRTDVSGDIELRSDGSTYNIRSSK